MVLVFSFQLLQIQIMQKIMYKYKNKERFQFVLPKMKYGNGRFRLRQRSNLCNHLMPTCQHYIALLTCFILFHFIFHFYIKFGIRKPNSVGIYYENFIHLFVLFFNFEAYSFTLEIRKKMIAIMNLN